MCIYHFVRTQCNHNERNAAKSGDILQVLTRKRVRAEGLPWLLRLRSRFRPRTNRSASQWKVLTNIVIPSPVCMWEREWMNGEVHVSSLLSSDAGNSPLHQQSRRSEAVNPRVLWPLWIVRSRPSVNHQDFGAGSDSLPHAETFSVIVMLIYSCADRGRSKWLTLPRLPACLLLDVYRKCLRSSRRRWNYCKKNGRQFALIAAA